MGLSPHWLDLFSDYDESYQLSVALISKLRKPQQLIITL